MENSEKTKVIQLCTDFLDDAWNEVDKNNIECEQLFTGYANKTYRCSIKHCVDLKKYEKTKYKEVIVRMYGGDLLEQKDTIKFNGEAGEALIIHILSEMGIAPKLLGVFVGGIIVEFIPSQISNFEDWKDMELCATFARKLARIHSASVPIAKIPQLTEKMKTISKSINKNDIGLKSLSIDKQKQYEFILSFPIDDEYEWIQKIIPKVSSKIVFSHNDLNTNNILLKDDYISMDDRIVFIDYECSTYFYRGRDFANFLIVKNLKFERNGNEVIISQDRTEDNARKVIIEEYLKEIKKLKPDDINEHLDTFEHLSMEVDFFDLLFRCDAVSITMPILAQSKVDIQMDFIVEVISDYNPKKKGFIHKYADVIQLE